MNVHYIGFEVSTAVIMKSIIFWDMILFDCSLNLTMMSSIEIFGQNPSLAEIG
jgi:hypothetical protein